MLTNFRMFIILEIYNFELTNFRVSGQSQVHFLGRGLGQTEHDLLDLDGVMCIKGSPVRRVEWSLGNKIPTLKSDEI